MSRTVEAYEAALAAMRAAAETMGGTVTEQVTGVYYVRTVGELRVDGAEPHLPELARLAREHGGTLYYYGADDRAALMVDLPVTSREAEIAHHEAAIAKLREASP